MATTTITLFPKGPQTASVGPGTVQGYKWNASTGVMTNGVKQPFAAASGALADAYVGISGRGTFVRFTNGAFKDQLVSGGAVKFPGGDPLALPVAAPTTPPPDTSPFTQADVDAKVRAAVKAAVDADRATAHITYG